MGSTKSYDENKKELNYQEMDIYNNLEILLKARNKIICRKEIALPCAIVDETDSLDIWDDDNISHVRPHKHLQDNEKLVSSLMGNIIKLKQTSEKEIDFNIDEGKNQDDEVRQALFCIRKQSEILFKKIINIQVSFNEDLNSNINIDNCEKKNFIKKHNKLIEETCKFDRGIEAIISCDKNMLKKHVEKDLKIESVEELKNICNELAPGVLSSVYDDGMKTFKIHEHLLSIKQYNKPSTNLLIDMVTTGKLDPFTRQPIIKPVTNKVCKHIYDQDSVSLMFQGKTFICCPYIGCKNKHFTKKDILNDLNTSNNSE